MSTRDLDAAGIEDPALRAAYERARVLNSAHGKTYYLATLLLPREKRPYVHALYGFARHADDLVDNPVDPDPGALPAFAERFLADLARGDSADPISMAAIHTARTWGIHREHFAAFLSSMQMDITITDYPTYADLEQYMYGSAAVIGLQMVPILGPLTDEAYPRARTLGEAFQLTNFIRDVGEDVRRGRIYLPLEDLARFGVDPAALRRLEMTPQVAELLAFEVARTRALYLRAEPGIDLLHPTSRDCIRTAFGLYGGILDEVERADYRVLDRRVSVPLTRRLAVAAPGLLRARLARRRPHRRPRQR